MPIGVIIDMTDQGQINLHAKIHRSQLIYNLVIRTRLTEWLNDGINHPLTQVCAPACLGKTNLNATWLDSLTADRVGSAISLHSGWLSLDGTVDLSSELIPYRDAEMKMTMARQ